MRALLVAMAAAGTACTPAYRPDAYPEGHPCRVLRGCASYVTLADGGAAPADAGVPGRPALCEPCEG
ncbi:MAG: hypothetical protein SFW67_21475 [Myxococcaceae bacterium]|nr:hypothetical protein [Myxococcaceae bacterium]